jgi:hypothetical protein
MVEEGFEFRSPPDPKCKCLCTKGTQLFSFISLASEYQQGQGAMTEFMNQSDSGLLYATLRIINKRISKRVRGKLSGWLMPIITATQEEEMEQTVFQDQPRQKLSETPS